MPNNSNEASRIAIEALARKKAAAANPLPKPKKPKKPKKTKKLYCQEDEDSWRDNLGLSSDY